MSLYRHFESAGIFWQIPKHVGYHHAKFMIPRFLSAVVLLTLGVTCAVADFETDQAAIDRLVQQGKFDLAEMLCREQLQGQVELERRSAFTVELLRVLTEKARQSTMVDADVTFRQAEAVAKAYLNADKQSTQRWLVEFQLALLPRLRADLRQWQMGGVRGDALHLRYLRDSLKQLQSLAERLDAELRKTSGRSKPKMSRGSMSVKAMRELRGRIALELGKTYRAQAEAYPAGSNDRSLAASEGARVLERVAPTSITPEWWWRCRMERMACLRLQSDWKTLARRFEVMLADKMPRTGKAELRAEAIRISLARKNWSRVKSLVAEGVPSINLSDPAMRVAADDLSLAYIEAYLALATHSQESGDGTAARDYESRAAAAVDARPDASAYWTRRVESLLARGSRGTTGSPGGFPLTVRAARGLYRQGKLPEAAAAYQRAAEQALAAGDRNEAFSLTMNAAGLLIKAEQTAEAAAYLRERSLANADSPAAADAHLLAIKLVAPKSVGESEDAEAKRYDRLLNEHLKWWPQGQTSDQVAWWRGKAREHAEKHSAALEDYLAISPEFKNRAAANAAVERCANAMSVGPVGEAASDGKGLAAAVLALVAVANDANAAPQARSEAALSATRIAMLHSEPTAELNASLAALQSRANTDAARMVLAEGLYRAGRRPDAQQEIEKVANASADQWLRMLQSSQPKMGASAVQRKGSSGWRLSLVERGSSSVNSLTIPQRLLWDRLHVIALADVGTDKSLAAASTKIGDLIKQLPKDAELRELHARLLASADDEGSVDAWRLVISGSPPQSRRWYDAKYELAKLHLEQGNKQRASQMIELLQALHPDLGGKEQKTKFQALLKQCE